MIVALFLSVLALVPWSRKPAPSTTWTATSGLRLAPVAKGLQNPVHLTAPPGDPRLFVVEQAGVIRIIENGAVRREPFLDVRDRVGSGGERGLLSLAFHPRYSRNGLFYVNFTDREGHTRIVRYRVSGDPYRADLPSEKVLLRIEQPYANHNGGQIAFGPDSMLWIGMGDGGSGGDPQDRAQNPRSLLGKMLRIDVDRGDPFAIPPTNPYRDGRARPEIWASGLRNPWRFAFDRASGMLWIADVGQNKWEEINAVSPRAAGLDFGWNRKEGLHPFRAGAKGPGRLTDPIAEYPHDEGCSVTGGHVYRGRAIPALVGTYVFSDYCKGWLRGLKWANGQVTERREWDLGSMGPVTSFGEDAAGELYVLTSDGAISRLEPAR